MLLTLPTLTLQSASYKAVELFPTNPLHYAPKLWLDGADASTVTESSGAVSKWDDKSGNNNDVTQDTEANKPTYENNGLTFDGASDFMSKDDVLIIPEDSSYTKMVVVSFTTTSGGNTISIGNSALFVPSGFPTVFHGSSEAASSEAISLSTRYLLTATYNNSTTTTKVFVNGVEKGSDNTSPSWTDSVQKLAIGSYSGSNHLNGILNEAIVYGRDLGDARSKVEAYLMKKWTI